MTKVGGDLLDKQQPKMLNSIDNTYRREHPFIP
jgi:hypothetical protein